MRGPAPNSQLVDGPTQLDPNFTSRVNPELGSTPDDLFDRINDFAFNGGLTTAGTPRPPCAQQPSVASIGELPEVSQYLKVKQNAP